MNGNQGRQVNLVETTDCLEAVGVCRGWKNFLFVIVAVCLLLLQASFWLVDTGYIKASGCTEKDVGPEQAKDTRQIEEAATKAAADANQPVGDLNQPAEVKVQEPRRGVRSLLHITYGCLDKVIRFVDAVLILAATLYCLTILFSLKLSLIGRLGGINHICRAFFLSLVMLVLLLPWQMLFANLVVGAIYTPDELTKWCTAETSGIFCTIIHYLRFTGYWAVVLLLLVVSQVRTSRWTKAILRRLEVI
jgi:hypothetical protein